MAFDPFAEERGASAPFDPFATDTAPAKKQNKGLIADIGTDLKRGVQQLPGAITGLADIAVGGISGKPLISNLADSAGEATGFQPAKWAKSAEAEYSPSRQAGRAEVDAAWENGTASDIAGAYLKNPMNIVGSVAESLPSMIAGGLAGRAALGIGAKAVSAGAGGVGPALPGIIARTVGTGLAPAVGAGIGEGGIMAGQAMANSLDAGVDPRTAAGYAGATGLVGGALGALGGKVAQRFGVVDPETLIAGGIGRQGSNATGLAAAKEVGKRMAGGAISEGLFEELPQSVFEQGFQNLAQDKPLTEGMARAGVEGALAGSFMGGAFNAIPGGRYAESKINAQTKPQDKQQPIAGLLPSPTYTGTPGEQIVAADAERQAAIDAADKNAADLYAMRDAFEAARQNVTLVADPVPVQQRIDAMLGLDTERMDKKGRALYEKDLAAAFNEPIGITHDANQREVPFTMGEYLDAQVKADDAVRARERIPAQTANQQASSRLTQLADEEAQQHAAITQDLVRSAAQGGALSKAALTGIQTGATQMPVHPERAAIEQQMLADEAAQAELAPIERLMRTRSDEEVQRVADNPKANPKMRQVAIADLQRRMATKAQPTTTSPLQQTATQLNMPAQNGIKQLQAQLEQTEPFTEQSSALTNQLQSAVTQDAQSALNAGEMPVYKVTDHVSVAIHPSAQNPGMVQVTRYTKDGVIGDSQYNNVDDAVRQEGLTHKPRIASNEAVAVIEKSIQAESEYQQRKSAAPVPNADAGIGVGGKSGYQQRKAEANATQSNQQKFYVPPIVEAMIGTAYKSADELRGAISNVKYGDIVDGVESINFSLKGKQYSAKMTGRNKDFVLTGNDSETDRAYALRALLDGGVTQSAPQSTESQKAANREKLAKAKSKKLKASGNIINDLKVLGVDPNMISRITDNGISATESINDLGEVAERLRSSEFGYIFDDVNNDAAQGLVEFLRRVASGDASPLNATRMEEDIAEREEYQHKKGVNERATELGLKKIGGKRTLQIVEAEIAAKEQEIAELEAREERAAIQASVIAEEIYKEGSELTEADLMQWLGAQIEYSQDEINEADSRSSEIESRRAEANSGYDTEEQAQGRGTEGAGTGSPEVGTRPTEGFSLAGQTNAEAAEAERKRIAAEAEESRLAAQDAADKKAAEKKSLEDAIRERAANPDNFQFGEDAKAAAKPMGSLFDQPYPAPVERKVTTEDARGQRDVFAQAENPSRPYKTSDERDEAIYRLKAKARNAGFEYVDSIIRDAAQYGAPESEISAAIDVGTDEAIDAVAEKYAKKNNGLKQGFGPGNNDSKLHSKPLSERDKRISELLGAGFYELPEIQRKEILKKAKARSVDAFEGMAISDRREAVEWWLDKQPVKATTEAKAVEPAAVDAKKEAKSEVIEGAGEKLEFARKYKVASMAKEYSDQELANLPLSKIWPADEIDSIEDAFIAAVSTAARAEIPAKPRKVYKVDSWVNKIKALRGLVQKVINSTETRDRLREMLKNWKTLDDFYSKVVLLESIDRAQWKRIGYVRERPDAYQYKDGNRVDTPMVSLEIDGKSHWIDNAGSVHDALDKINKLLGVETKPKLMEFEVRGKGNSYFINKKGDREYRKLKTFTSTEEAFKFRKENYDELVSAWEAVKDSDNVKKTDVRNAENRPRTGQDWRKGKNVDSQTFIDTFGFRAADFGNWVKQGDDAKERQGMLNQAYDALMDLSEIVGLPPKAISLNGTLALGFGLDGKGWASAHFSPDKLFINLTKTRGAGSIAHEWLHALDNYFARMRNDGNEVQFTGDQNAYRKDNFVTYKPEAMYVHKTKRSTPMSRADLQRMHEQAPSSEYWITDNWEKDKNHPEGIRPQVEKAFSELVETLNASPMLARARKIDKGPDGYWSRIIERGARSFENYVIHKMMEGGYQNDYLANVKSAEDFSRDKGRYPYLLPEEVAPVAEAFDNLFNTLETKETDKGIALMEESAVYNVNEPDAFTGDIFQGTEHALPETKRRAIPAGRQSRARADDGQGVSRVLAVREAADTPGVYHVSAQLVTVGERQLPVATVKTSEDAARAFAHLSRFAVEHMDGLVTDKDGKPLAIIGAFKGAPTQASVYSSTLMMELARIDGAANLWLSHNHPSGMPNLSEADRTLSRNFRKILRDTSVTYQGLSAMARRGDTIRWEDDDYNSGEVSANEPTPHRVPIVERELVNSNPVSKVGGPQDAKRLVPDLAKDSPGVVFLTAQNEIASFVPFSPEEMGELRSGSRLMKLFNAAAKSGATGALVAMPDGKVTTAQFGNLKGALGTIDVGVFDGIRYDSAATDGGKSVAESGEYVDSVGANFFSRGNGATQGQSFPRAQAESRIKSILGDKLGKVLIDSGIVTFTNKGNEYQGATYKDGSIVLNLDALSADNFDGVLLHEGMHSTIRDIVGEATYAKLMKQLENMHAMGKGAQWVKDANAAIPSDTKADHRTEELAAYAIEQYVNGAKQPNVITRWVESLLSALRTAIIRRLPFGKLKSWAVNNLQPQDLANLAIAGLKAKARGQLQAQGREAMAYSNNENLNRNGEVFYTQIYGNEIGRSSGKTIQEKASNWMRENLQGKSFKNYSTGWDISIGRKGINKSMMHSSKDVHARSVTAIPSMLNNAVLVYSEQNNNEKERESVPLVHHFYAPLIVGNREYIARMVVKEATDGHRFYDYDTSDEISPAVNDTTLPFSQRMGAASGARLTMSMDKLLSHVKKEHGGTDSKFSKINQTDTPAFKKWFGDSKVVDADGKPLVVYHGTDKSFNSFDPARQGEKDSGWYGVGYYMTADPETASAYSMYDEMRDGSPTTGANVMPLYVSIKNPYVWPDNRVAAKTKDEANAITKELISKGYDGVIVPNNYQAPEYASHHEVIAFSNTQIKSAIGNNGDFGTNPDIRYSRAQIIGDSGRQYDQTQRQFFKNVGRDIDKKNLVERTTEYLKNDFWKKMAVGIVDQFRGLRDLGDNGQAYMLARLSKGTAGAFDALLHHGKLSIRDGVYDADTSGGFIERLGEPLHGELDDFLWYVAANRAEGLSKVDRENLFTPADIAAGKSLAKGQTNFDYTIQTGPQKGTTTRNRTLIYADANRVFNEFQKNTLDMAEQSGLIDGANRKLWESEFYVPFYRVSEEDGEFIGAKMGNALVRQQAFKKLKGGTDKLNSDLLSNTLLNFSHLIEASAKNRAAKASLAAAEQIGVAERVAPDMASYTASNGSMLPPGTKGTVWFQENGKKVEYKVTDPFVMTAITSLEYAGMRNGVMDVMTKFKHWLTIGVTASPAFKVRNLIRDSIQSIGASDLSYNPIKNIAEGYKQTKRDSQEYVSALASGGLIRFGTMLEGSESSRVRQLVKSGVKDSTILNSENKWRAFYDQYLDPVVSAYNELGNRSEEINRAALYNQLIKQGKSHAEAALLARDLMDFSMQGSFNTIRFLTQVVPFMNARLQGMYKLGRAAKDNPRKLAVVTGAVALASIALMLAYGDDDDWKRREDWDRDGFWWFKLGGIEFRIPKPFEVGAIGSLAERGLELMIDDEMTGERFRRVVSSLVMNNLSMNPIPQAFKPILDLYANKDSFTGRPIESMGMQRLDPTERFNSNTSMIARGMSNASFGALSPVQIDHLARAYFGWLGSFVIGGADMAFRGMSDQPTKPALDYFKFGTQGILKEAGTGSSRYVTQVYEQAKELEQAHATYRQMIKDGRIDEAKDYAADNQDKMIRYRQVEAVKKVESNLNERIRKIERSDMDSGEKKDAIALINKQKEQVAKRIAAGAS